MDFKNAVSLLKEGHKICRRKWVDKYIVCNEENNDIWEYYRASHPYNYTADIILSAGWEVINEKSNSLDFPEAYERLKQGCRIRLSEWSQAYLIYNNHTLVINKIQQAIYQTHCEDFNATDWEIYPEHQGDLPETKF